MSLYEITACAHLSPESAKQSGLIAHSSGYAVVSVSEFAFNYAKCIAVLFATKLNQIVHASYN